MKRARRSGTPMISSLEMPMRTAVRMKLVSRRATEDATIKGRRSRVLKANWQIRMLRTLAVELRRMTAQPSI
jgi:hypothetical protein